MTVPAAGSAGACLFGLAALATSVFVLDRPTNLNVDISGFWDQAVVLSILWRFVAAPASTASAQRAQAAASLATESSKPGAEAGGEVETL